MMFRQKLQRAAAWVRAHPDRFWAVSGTIVLVAVLIILVSVHNQTENEEAWTQLGAVQGYLLQNQNDAAGKALEQWKSRFSNSSAASYAKFLQADLLYRTADYVGAARVYGELAETARPDLLRPLALAAQGSAEEMAGHLPQAQALARTFLERYPDHFLAGPALLSQARLAEAAGATSEASALYERFTLLYPQSPFASFAQARRK